VGVGQREELGDDDIPSTDDDSQLTCKPGELDSRLIHELYEDIICVSRQ
jgi:hypothetical protein